MSEKTKGADKKYTYTEFLREFFPNVDISGQDQGQADQLDSQRLHEVMLKIQSLREAAKKKEPA